LGRSILKSLLPSQKAAATTNTKTNIICIAQN
jgi:hypothetical protein